MRRVELDHKAKIAWVKSGDIALASFAFDHWGGANKAQMAAEAYMSDRTEDPWEMIARIDALERQVKAADALAEAVTEYVAAEEELGGSGHPEDHALIFDTWDTVQAALAAYRAAKEGGA